MSLRPWLQDAASSDRSEDTSNPSGSSETESSSSSRFQCQSGSSSDSGSSSHSSSDDCAELREMQARERRQARTAKARAAAISAKATRRLARQAVLALPEHPAGQYRDDVKSNNSLIQGWSNQRRRVRLLMSYLKAWALAMVNVATQTGDRISHVLTTCVCDDTNMRLSSGVPDLPQWKMSRVISVMNLVQNVIIYQGSGSKYKGYSVHTPLSCLAKSDKVGLGAEFCSRLFLFLGKLSRRFQLLNMPGDLMSNVQIQALCLCFDSLVTNLAVLKQFRLAVCDHHRNLKTSASANDEGAGESPHLDKIFPLIHFCCAIHQLALARKPLLHGFPQFWSAITRLTHLFEVHSFRVHFRAALVEVICNGFRYIPVCSLPEESAEWRQFRQESCGIITDQNTGYNKKRVELHQQLGTYDNGDIESQHFTHYCIGNCCSGDTHAEKAK